MQQFWGRLTRILHQLCLHSLDIQYKSNVWTHSCIWNHVVLKIVLNKSKYILDFRFFKVATLWWQLCTPLAFSQPASWGMLIQQSWKGSCICWALVDCFSFTLWSNSSQTISIGLRSGDCGQVIWCITLLGQIALTQPGGPGWKTYDSPTKRKPDGIAYRCRMLW